MTAITLESGLWKKLNCGAPYNSLLDHLKSKIQNKSRLLYPQLPMQRRESFSEFPFFTFLEHFEGKIVIICEKIS